MAAEKESLKTLPRAPMVSKRWTFSRLHIISFEYLNPAKDWAKLPFLRVKPILAGWMRIQWTLALFPPPLPSREKSDSWLSLWIYKSLLRYEAASWFTNLGCWWLTRTIKKQERKSEPQQVRRAEICPASEQWGTSRSVWPMTEAHFLQNYIMLFCSYQSSCFSLKSWRHTANICSFYN